MPHGTVKNILLLKQDVLIIKELMMMLQTQSPRRLPSLNLLQSGSLTLAWEVLEWGPGG